MNEREQIFVILMVTLFAGTSFWPVALGWVDLTTLEGWVELVANFGLCGLTVAVLSFGGFVGYVLASAGRFIFRALTGGATEERAWACRVVVGVGRGLYRVLDGCWKLAWALCHSRRSDVDTPGA